MHHYVTFRSTSFPDGRLAYHYHVPASAPLDEAGFNEWLTRYIGPADGLATVSLLLIREYRDVNGALSGFILERRRDTADGAYYGDPARVEVTGPARRVRSFRATDDGTLEPAGPVTGRQAAGAPRGDLLAGEEQAVRAAYGERSRILAVRDPTALEDQVGLSAIIHLAAEDDRELICGLGWHGTTPFFIEGAFPLRDGEALAETSNSSDFGQPEFQSADQTVWLRYVERYERLVVLDVRPHGVASDMLVLTGDAAGRIAWHLVDGDGVELWRKMPEQVPVDSAAGPGHRAAQGSTANDGRHVPPGAAPGQARPA